MKLDFTKSKWQPCTNFPRVSEGQNKEKCTIDILNDSVAPSYRAGILHVRCLYSLPD